MPAMELNVVSAPHPIAPPTRVAAGAPPPPLRRKLHLPTEPLLFAAVLLMLMLVIAKAVPGSADADSPAAQSSSLVSPGGKQG